MVAKLIPEYKSDVYVENVCTFCFCCANFLGVTLLMLFIVSYSTECKSYKSFNIIIIIILKAVISYFVFFKVFLESSDDLIQRTNIYRQFKYKNYGQIKQMKLSRVPKILATFVHCTSLQISWARQLGACPLGPQPVHQFVMLRPCYK